MERRSPAQVYALLFGIVLVGAGIIGFLYEPAFSTGDAASREALLGILDVNGWHNVVHILTGALGLAAAHSYERSRTYAFGLGIVYIAVAIWGFALGDGGTILNLIPVNSEDNVLHALIGIAGLAAGAATPAVQPPSTARAAAA